MPSEQLIAAKDFEKARIPSAQVFDIEELSDKQSAFPHMLPSKAEFEQAIRRFGINQAQPVVVYDAKGVLSSPRAAWMFEVFQHSNVAVLGVCLLL
jgi:thiosulfate/3-mercaptopyruvate sulfurtransferase